MTKSSDTKSGFTLVELLVSVGIMLVFLPFAASMLTNSRLLASYSKHRIEAAYAAQQIIETDRQGAFVTLAAGQSNIIGPSSVILDTKGNYVNPNCNNGTTDFCGTAVVTITPEVYTNSAGTKSTNTLVDHYSVAINWYEQIVKLRVPMTETYAEDIANDPMLN